MKKKAVSILCAAAMTAGMLAGCGGTEPKEDETKKTAQEQEDKKEETGDETETAEEKKWTNPEEWKKRHTVDDIYGMMDELAAKHPEYTEVGSLGQTTKGNELKLLTITDHSVPDDEKTGIGIMANIHGDERESAESAAYTTAWFLENLEDETVKEILQKHIIYSVPILNPDSHNIYEYFVRGTSQEVDKNGDGEPCNDLYEDITGDGWMGEIYTSSGKNEEDPWSTLTGYVGYESKDPDGNGWLGDDAWASGVDINRNFDFEWAPDHASNGGPNAASEIETQHIQKFLEETPMAAMTTMHTGIQTILYPWGYRDTDTSNAEEVADMEFMANAAEKMRKAFETTAQRNFYVKNSYNDYPTYSELIDYAYGVYGIHCYTIEVYGSGADNQDEEGTSTAYDPNHEPDDWKVCAWNDTEWEDSRMDYYSYDEFVEILKAADLNPENVKVKVYDAEGNETDEETTLAAMAPEGVYVYASDRNQRGTYVPKDQDMMVAGAKDAVLQMIYAEGAVQDPAAK